MEYVIAYNRNNITSGAVVYALEREDDARADQCEALEAEVRGPRCRQSVSVLGRV